MNPHREDEIDYCVFYCAMCDEEYTLPDIAIKCPICGSDDIEEI